MIGILPKNLDFLMYRLQKREKESGEKFFKRLKRAKMEINKIEKQRDYFDYIYNVDRNNESKICRDVENYIRNYYQFI